MSVLELQEVAYSYDKKKKVLKGIDVQMETGKMYAILGPSGSSLSRYFLWIF